MLDDSRRNHHLRPSLAAKKRKPTKKRGKGTSAAKKRKQAAKKASKASKARKVTSGAKPRKGRKHARKVQPRKGTKRAAKSGSVRKGKRKALTKKSGKTRVAGHAHKSKARPKKHSAKGKKTRVGSKPRKRKAAKPRNQRASTAKKQKPSRTVPKARKKHAGQKSASKATVVIVHTYPGTPSEYFAVKIGKQWLRTPVKKLRRTFRTHLEAFKAVQKALGRPFYYTTVVEEASGEPPSTAPREHGTELSTGGALLPERGEELSTGAAIVEERIRGQELSAEQLAPPGSARVPQYLAPNIYYVNIAKFDDYSERGDEEDEIERYMTSTAGMSKHNTNYMDIFKQAFYDYVKKTPFEDVDDVPIYRFGIVIRSLKPRSAEALTTLIYQFRDFLKDMLPKGAVAHIVDEDKYISVRLGLGSNRRPSTFTQAHETMVRNRELLDNFREGTKDLIDDFVWFEFWDTEEDYAYQ